MRMTDAIRLIQYHILDWESLWDRDTFLTYAADLGMGKITIEWIRHEAVHLRLRREVQTLRAHQVRSEV